MSPSHDFLNKKEILRNKKETLLYIFFRIIFNVKSSMQSKIMINYEIVHRFQNIAT